MKIFANKGVLDIRGTRIGVYFILNAKMHFARTANIRVEDNSVIYICNFRT